MSMYGPEEVSSKILNEVSEEKNDDIENIASLASGNYKIVRSV